MTLLKLQQAHSNFIIINRTRTPLFHSVYIIKEIQLKVILIEQFQTIRKLTNNYPSPINVDDNYLLDDHVFQDDNIKELHKLKN